VHGLDALATTLEDVLAGGAGANAFERLEHLATLVRRRGACAHPDGTANLVLSALQAFGPELADHARHGPCERCAGPAALPLPIYQAPAAPSREPLSFR
jgi:NADH:ubiquinone oxidoreductase subunit F (NADH-binding)